MKPAERCLFPGCSAPVYARGLCRADYVRQLKREGRISPRRCPAGSCSAPGCAAPLYARQLCAGHYRRQLARKPLAPPLRTPYPPRRSLQFSALPQAPHVLRHVPPALSA